MMLIDNHWTVSLSFTTGLGRVISYGFGYFRVFRIKTQSFLSGVVKTGLPVTRKLPTFVDNPLRGLYQETTISLPRIDLKLSLISLYEGIYISTIFLST